MKKFLSIALFLIVTTICIVAFTYPENKKHAIILTNECIQCGVCIEVCPNGAIKLNYDGTYTVYIGKCKGCGYCMDACPVGAIWLEQIELNYSN